MSASGSRTRPRGPGRRAMAPWDTLAADRTHGASELQRRAVVSLRSLVREGPPKLGDAEVAWLLQWCRGMRAAQPSMGGLVRLADEVSSWVQEEGPEPSRRGLRALLSGKERELSREIGDLVRFAARHFPVRAVVVTLSRSSTVSEVLCRLPLRCRPTEVVVLRSLPGGEGADMARELRAHGLNARVVEDDDLEGALGPSAVVLVGADTLYADGTLVHKVGTRRVARTAHRRGVPFIAMVPSSRVLPCRPRRGRRRPPLFDETPWRWIGQVWTDRGAWSPPRP